MTVRESPRVTVDYNEIRSWVAERGGRPALDEKGRPTIDLSGKLRDISWQDFFVRFEEERLAFSYEKDGDFCELVERQGLDERSEQTNIY